MKEQSPRSINTSSRNSETEYYNFRVILVIFEKHNFVIFYSDILSRRMSFHCLVRILNFFSQQIFPWNIWNTTRTLHAGYQTYAVAMSAGSVQPTG